MDALHFLFQDYQYLFLPPQPFAGRIGFSFKITLLYIKRIRFSIYIYEFSS